MDFSASLNTCIFCSFGISNFFFFHLAFTIKLRYIIGMKTQHIFLQVFHYCRGLAVAWRSTAAGFFEPGYECCVDNSLFPGPIWCISNTNVDEVNAVQPCTKL